jgi:hypothetical protein
MNITKKTTYQLELNEKEKVFLYLLVSRATDLKGFLERTADDQEDYEDFLHSLELRLSQRIE